MKKYILFVFFCLTMFVLQGQNAQDIIEKHCKATAIKDLSGQLTYTNTSKAGRTQTRTLKQFILCNDPIHNTYNMLLEFIAPSDVVGTATLTIQHANKADDQWLYLPALRTSKRISPSKKSDRFMGTEMTYEDLSNYLAESSDDFQYRFIVEEKLDGRSAYKIEAKPNDVTTTQYSKRTLWIDKTTHLMLRTDFYDLKGNLLKVFRASDIKVIPSSKDYYRAHKIELENVQTGNMTKVVYTDFIINKGIKSDMFSTTWLETK